MDEEAVFTESAQITNNANCGNLGELLQIIVLAFSVTGICYYSYYLLAPWIWTQNIPFNPKDITPWIRVWTAEHDGIEIYALYILLFINCVSAVTLTWFSGRFREKRISTIVMVISSIISVIFCISIGFTPPMLPKHTETLLDVAIRALLLTPITEIIVYSLCYLQLHSSRLATVVIAIMLAPVCFIATEPISLLDYSYIFTPALRLIKGFSINDIYFQYDLLLSLLAAAWMKLGLDLNTFQILGQLAYYIAILTVFLLSKKLFCTKELSIFLVTALVLGRIYASPYDAAVVFQVTPLRLDLWMILLISVYYFGAYHWTAGLICGFLILFHKNFGILYASAYLQFLITLSTVDYLDNREAKPFPDRLVFCLKRCFSPTMIILFFSITSYLVFKNEQFGGYSGYYQKIGIGFIQIATTSFYWYVPVMLSIAFTLLLRLRKQLTSDYFSTGILLLFCMIGNSVYFFGRSTENNILNISIGLLFVFFLMLDLVTRFIQTCNQTAVHALLQRYVANSMAIILIAVFLVSYAHNILSKTDFQIRNISKMQLIYPSVLDLPSLQMYLSKIRHATGNSDKIYFVDSADFELYYYGNYSPVGYCTPFKTWIFTSELRQFLQELLNKGYYLVCSDEMKFLLADLHYSDNVPIGSSVLISSQSRTSFIRYPMNSSEK